MSAMTHHIFRVPLRQQFAKIEQEPPELEKPWLLTDGQPYGAIFTGTATAKCARSHKGTKLADFLYNPFRWLYASEKARDLLAAEPVTFEFYPLTVVDQKDKPVPQPYFLAHLLGTADCVDLERSQYVRSSFRPDLIQIMKRLVLDPARIPQEATIFRIKEQPETMIVRSDLVERLREAGVGGFELWELDTPISM